MKMTRVCVFHVGQKYASDSPGIVGECLAVLDIKLTSLQGMETRHAITPHQNLQVSLHINTAYQHSLIQFWINRMMGAATQARHKNFDTTHPPVRVKHFISCSYRDLDFLATHLDGITTVSYTDELVKKTSGKGDCCMLTVVEWGHSRLVCEEYPEY